MRSTKHETAPVAPKLPGPSAIFGRMEKTTRYGMTPDEWDAVRERARQHIIGCAKRRETTTYSEISQVVAPARITPRSFAMMRLLNEICTREDEARGVMLASLVVRKDTGMPGDGYFGCASGLGRETADRKAFWEAEVERVYAAFSGEE
jgi:hypothetical protein